MEATPQLKPFPPIPEDIARYIMEVAAELDESTLPVARTLVVLSKLVKAWIDPVLHRVVILRTEARMVDFSRGRTNYVVSGAVSDNIRRKVRRLGLLYPLRCNPHVLRRIIDTIEPASLWDLCMYRSHFRVILSLASPPQGNLMPRKLTLSFLDLSNLVQCPVEGLLRNVTHLRLGLFRNAPEPSTLLVISKLLSRLTHFAMSTFERHDWGDEGPLLHWMLEKSGFPCLEIFVLEVVIMPTWEMQVITQVAPSIWETTTRFKDMHNFFTVATWPPFTGTRVGDDYRKQAVDGEEDIWERARRERLERIRLNLKPYERLPQ